MAHVKAFEIGVFAQVQGGERSARVFERQCGGFRRCVAQSVVAQTQSLQRCVIGKFERNDFVVVKFE